MEGQFILTDYVEEALAQATYDKLDDGTFSARIPPCVGVIAFSSTLKKCEDELRSVLEDWILLGVKLGHPLPVIAGIDLNEEPQCEPVDSV
jgi:predicted RNase H-like HicB family nuclease